MNPSALTFLETHEARRLAAAWPIFHARCVREAAEFVTQTVEERVVMQPHVWKEIAACDGTDPMDTLMSALEDNGICLPDGTLDPLAEQFIADAARAACGIQVTTRAGDVEVTRGAPSFEPPIPYRKDTSGRIVQRHPVTGEVIGEVESWNTRCVGCGKGVVARFKPPIICGDCVRTLSVETRERLLREAAAREFGPPSGAKFDNTAPVDDDLPLDDREVAAVVGTLRALVGHATGCTSEACVPICPRGGKARESVKP